ncbi:MAG TPA: alpha-amylase family protein [Phycisphaerae bacterium]|nr:alpha-amylase family protein [Phycisphaerae bacterium]
MPHLSRRRALQSFAAAGAAALCPPTLVAQQSAPAVAPPTETRWQRSAADRRQRARGITWLSHEPLEFLLRRGDRSTDVAQTYARMLDPDNIRQMAAAGVKWGRIFFYKGFGLEHERPHIAQAQKVADLMHSLGMKVSLYVGGTMFIETLYQELPEARNWEQRDASNRPVPYGSQLFRHYACPNEPAYREYLRKVLTVGVNDLHADEFAFDNIMLQPEPHSCRCPRCLTAFAAFLRRRYPTPEDAFDRFGIDNVADLQVNAWQSDDEPAAIAALDDPVLQEWVRFRCESLANYAGALYDITKTLNPDVAVLLNIKGIYSFNRYWTNAVYHPLYAGRVDLVAFDTGGYNEHIDPATGALISQVRSYKMARRINSACEDSFSDDLRAATHMAFGLQKPLPGLAPAPEGSGAFNVFTPLMEFFRHYNDRYFTQTNNVADVAILRNWPTMAYSNSAAYVPATLMEQVLIQYKVPFDLLFDEQLNRLPQYSTLILAGQECVADDQLQTLLAFVRTGGTLILVGNVGQYDQYRARRPQNPLLPARTEGQGRILYAPTIQRADQPRRSAAQTSDPEPGAPAPRASGAERFNPPQWLLPKNHKELFQRVADSVPGGLSLTTTAPLTTLAELLVRGPSRETLAHFINFDRSPPRSPVSPFSVTLKKSFPGPAKSLLWLSPESDNPLPLQFQDTPTHTTFTTPTLQIYGMAALAQ